MDVATNVFHSTLSVLATVGSAFGSATAGIARFLAQSLATTAGLLGFNNILARLPPDLAALGNGFVKELNLIGSFTTALSKGEGLVGSFKTALSSLAQTEATESEATEKAAKSHQDLLDKLAPEEAALAKAKGDLMLLTRPLRIPLT